MRLFASVLFVLLVVLSPSVVHSRTWYVKLDGTGDAPTIQAAIDSAQSGDEILVAAGTYTWANQSPCGVFEGLICLDKEVWLHSESGPEVTILDAQDQGRVIQVYAEGSDISPTIEGFTITRGSTDDLFAGAGIAAYSCSPTVKDNIATDNWTMDRGGAFFFSYSTSMITDNIITHNVGNFSGGAIYCTASNIVVTDNVITNNVTVLDGGGICSFNDSDPQIADNFIADNVAGRGGGVFCGDSATVSGNVIVGNQADYGGGIDCYIGSPTISQNTIVGNSAPQGAGIRCWSGTAPSITRNIVGSSLLGEGIYCVGSAAPTITCNDLWDNAGGDGNCTPGPDNFSADPMFCDDATRDYQLHEDSPCKPGNSPTECGLVGALPVGCWNTPFGPAAAIVLLGALAGLGAWRAAGRVRSRSRSG